MDSRLPDSGSVILTEKESGSGFEKIPPELKHAIVEILADTKPGLPEYWKKENQTTK